MPKGEVVLDSGSTAWVLVSAALVLFMTPGLAFFYGGMVRSKNVLTAQKVQAKRQPRLNCSSVIGR